MRADLEALEREEREHADDLRRVAHIVRVQCPPEFAQTAAEILLAAHEANDRADRLATLRAGVVDRAPAAWWQHCIANGEWHRHDGLTHLAVLMLDGADLSSRGSREDAMRNALAAALGRTDTGEG